MYPIKRSCFHRFVHLVNPKILSHAFKNFNTYSMDLNLELSLVSLHYQPIDLEEEVPRAQTPPPQPDYSHLHPQSLVLYEDPFFIRKSITYSDMAWGFFIRNAWLPTILPFMHSRAMSSLISRGNTSVSVKDLDTDTDHEVVMKSWTNFKRFILAGGWFEHFVRRRKINLGDVVGLIWDKSNQRFLFKILQRVEQRPDFSHLEALAREDLYNDDDVMMNA